MSELINTDNHNNINRVPYLIIIMIILILFIYLLLTIRKYLLSYLIFLHEWHTWRFVIEMY